MIRTSRIFQAAFDPQWFKGSKVVDTAGEPLRCYHGTLNGGFANFKPSTSGTYGDGIYLTTDPQTASFWAGDRESEGIENDFGGSVYPVYVRMLNPADEDLASELESRFGSSTSKELQRLGYDGVLARDGEIVVFNNDQIRPAFSI